MSEFSRRVFLKSIGATAIAIANARSFFPAEILAGASEESSFEFLVVGDSLVWGQGLEEKDKFYTLTKNWLHREIFSETRNVNLKVKAHSGATIFLHEDESKALQANGGEKTETYHPEVNVSFPCLKDQIEIAKNEYDADGKNPGNVKLIMVSGGLVDISVARILNPFGKDKVLIDEIRRYCNEDMSRFLEQTSNAFPNALIVVLGYFPMISRFTRKHQMFNAILESYDVPRPLKPLLNNPVTHPVLNLLLRKGAIRRSRVWSENSDRELQNAVNRFNEKTGSQGAVFVKSPIDEKTCFNTKQTLLFGIEKNGRSGDFLYDQRLVECKKTIGEVKKKYGLKQSVRFCEVAAIGHPNIEGTRAYAETIKQKLEPLLKPK